MRRRQLRTVLIACIVVVSLALLAFVIGLTMALNGVRYDLRPDPTVGSNRNSQSSHFSQIRNVYKYSVVPGGIQSKDELAADLADPVVSKHYSGLILSRVKLIQSERDLRFYVSYRVPYGIFWTNKEITIPAGETLLTDGNLIIRSRCGNRLSLTPQLPTTELQPEILDTYSELEVPHLPQYGGLSGAYATTPAPVGGISPITFRLFGPPFLPVSVHPVSSASIPPAGILTFVILALIWFRIRHSLRNK